jgi:hypothetical protein
VKAHPEDTNTVPRAVRRTIWLDHAEHAMELPADEEDDKEVMGIPKVLEVGTFPFLPGEEDHDAKADGHDPPSGTGPSGEVGLEEGEELGATCRCRSVGNREFGKVDHVRENMNDSADDDRPSSGLMEGDVLVKGDDVVQRRATEEGDEIAADGEKDEDDINM